MAERTPEQGRRIGRAAFLGTVAAVVAGIAVAPAINRAVNRASGTLIPGGLSGLTGGDGWRIYAVSSPMPRFDPGDYTLEIGGEVERPVTLTWADLLRLPAVRQVSDFHCVTGWSVDDVRWRGVRGQAVIDLVRPRPGARHVRFVSMEDPYADELTLEQFALPDVLLATHMDDAPLSRAHGAPLRLVMPRMYGYKSVKWVRSISFATESTTGYWEANGYDADAWVGDSNGL